MQSSDRQKILAGALVVLILVFAIVQYLRRNPPRPEPTAPGYYTGPKVPKSGDRSIVVTEDGKITPAPPEIANPSMKTDAGGKEDSKRGTEKGESKSEPGKGGP